MPKTFSFLPLFSIFNKLIRKKTFPIVWLICLTTTALCFGKQDHQPANRSLWDVLDYYGFSKPQQKQSLEFIMKKAGIIKPTETFMTVFPKRDNTSLLFQDVLHFVELTQKYFTIRTGNQERWEVQPTAWMTENIDESASALKNLKLTDSISPTNSNPDLIAIFGAAMGAMKSRFNYIDKLYKSNTIKVNFLALLTGERKASIGIDGSEQELTEIAKKHNTTIDKLIETTLMLEAYHGSTISSKLPTENHLILIDIPMKNHLRPTTETTVQGLCNWLKKHEDIHSIVFISSQPHVKYQEAIVKEVFKQQGLQVKFEVVGYKTGAINAKTIQRLIGALGTQIWAQTPELISQAKIYTNDESLKAKFVKLYETQPLIYSNVKSLLSLHNDEPK